MNIRPAIPADIHKLSRLWFKLCTEHDPSLSPDSIMWRNMTLHDLNNKNFYMLVAEDGGKLIGFVSFTVTYEPMYSKIVAQGGHLYVLPEYRGQKIGEQLYQSAVSQFKKRNGQVISIVCFDDAKDLWLHYGYKQVHSIMEKEI